MKPILFLGALALPLLLAGCGTYVGVDDGYGPGYAYGPGYYDGVYGDVGVYGYDRGSYHQHYHHYDGSAHNTSVASHSFSHANVASNSHVSGGHVGGGGGGGASHASASVGGGGHH